MIRFGTLFALYQREEEDAKRELGRREQHRAAVLAERARIEAGLESAGHGLDPTQHEIYLAWWQAEQIRLAACDRRIQEAESAVASALNALGEAHRRRTTFEKLRERDREQDRRRADRREQRANDDRAAARHAGG